MAIRQKPKKSRTSASPPSRLTTRCAPQLNLPDGVGLTVMTVDHKGPAAADIQPNDVLQKLDDQLLIDAHQLVTLIHLHKRGDKVVLTIIREAKPIKVTITLGEKERNRAARQRGRSHGRFAR